MPVVSGSLLERITIDPEVRFGKPCIRGHRITVQEVLEWLASGATQQQIFDFRNSSPRISWLFTLMPPDWLLIRTQEDEAPVRRKPAATTG
jgi:Protein of unknown function (DUF433)